MYGVAAAVALVALIFGLAVPAAAHVTDAAFPFTCNNVNLNVEGADWVDGFPSGSWQSGHRGVRSDMHITDDPEECARVSSLGVLNRSNGEQVEVGWILGWGCNSLTYIHNPKILTVSVVGSTITCRTHTGTVLPENVTRTFNVNDIDQDTVWDYQYEGTVYFTFNMPWRSGTGITNGERDGTVDTAWSNFRNIEERWASEWNDWDHVEDFFDNDADFKFCDWGSNHNGVEGEAGPCDSTQ